MDVVSTQYATNKIIENERKTRFQQKEYIILEEIYIILEEIYK